jgi:DNA topoisomerase-1
VSEELVHAYMARRALDYLVGFTLSPVLWRRLPGAKSAGRVQSVALRLVSDREAAIEVFVPTEYWSIDVELSTGEHDPPLLAALTHVDGEKLPEMGICNGREAEALAERIRAAAFKVLDVSCKTQQRSPLPPFTTSTMQQEASRWLGFGASRTMSAAQKLYEGAGTGEGLITYMRTDGLQLAEEAVSAIRETVARSYGEAFVPEQPRVYKSRAKNAQE